MSLPCRPVASWTRRCRRSCDGTRIPCPPSSPAIKHDNIQDQSIYYKSTLYAP